MPITISNPTVERIMRLILSNQPHQKMSLELITDSFLQFAVQFFKDVVIAKCEGKEINKSWYKRYFLLGRFESTDTLVYAGLNKKTVTNIYGGASRPLVFDITPKYHDELIEKIDSLVGLDYGDLEIDLAIRYRDVTVHLNLSETLIVVNTLAAKRAQLRGGTWSSIGKQIELPLMLTLAKLYQVPASHYAGKGLTSEDREVDFHFLDRHGNQYFCEVKLMGKGNPESADSTIARDTDIFIAHTLSDLNKDQLDQRGCRWVALREVEGYRRIYDIFKELNIPCAPFHGDLDSALNSIIPSVFEEIAP